MRTIKTRSLLDPRARSAHGGGVEAYEPYPSLALALLSGLLIGLEREHSKPSHAEQRGFAGGVRTYPLFALLGATSVMLL